MPTLPKKNKKLVSISQAADILGVSIDTVRRWDKKGVIKSIRGKGNIRYFLSHDLEKHIFVRPLTISEVADKLGISPTTLRRLDARGIIKPVRSATGERLYTRESIDDFLHENYFLRKRQIEQSTEFPVMQEISPQEVELVNELPAREAMLSNFLSQKEKEINKLIIFRNIVIGTCIAIITLFSFIITAITLFFLLFPEDAARVLGYSKPDTYTMVSQPFDTERSRSAQSKPLEVNTQVLGAQIKVSDKEESLFVRVLRPFSKLSLRIVKTIDKKTYQKIVPDGMIEDVNDVLVIDPNNNIIATKPIRISEASLLQIGDTHVITNLNSQYVQGKTPGDDNGDLVVFAENGRIENLTVVAENIAPGSITADKLAPGVTIPAEEDEQEETSVSSLNELTGALTILGGGIVAISTGTDRLTIVGTEADTLSTVVGRGATTSTAVALNGGISSSSSNPLSFSAIDPSISIGNAGTLSITDGTNTLFRVADNGTTGTLTVNAATVSSLNTAGGLVYTNGSGVLSVSAQGTNGECLLSGGSGAPTWGSCAASSGDITAVGDVISGAAFTQTAGNDGNTLYFEGTTSDSNEISLNASDPGSDIAVTIPAIVGTLTSLAGSQTFTGLKTFDVGLAITTGQTFTMNGDAFTDLTGMGLTIASGALQTTLGTSVDLTSEVNGVLPLANGGTNKALSASNGQVVYSDSDSFELTTGGSTGQCLQYNSGGAPTWGNCGSGGGGSSNWRIASGTLSPINDTLDMLVGSNASSSAKFGLLNVNSGTPTASISANAGNNATYVTGAGVLGTTNAQTLNIGNASTGNVVIDSGSGVITLSDGTIINGTLTATGTVNGATITGGSLTSTAVNGVTIADIALTSGSYADPAWITSLAKSKVGLSNVENTALSTWAGSSNMTTVGTLTSGGTGAGFTLNFTNSTLSGNITGSNIDESTLVGLTTSNFSSANISQWTNNAGYLTAATESWNTGNGVLTPRFAATVDLLLGAMSTSSAKFGFINVNSGTPTATISGNIVLDAAGSLQTTKNQTLSLGGSTTGNIVIDSGSGLITFSDNTVLNGTLTGLNGLTVGSGTVSLPAGEIGNSELANSSLTVSAGSGLANGGAVSLGGSTTLNIGAGNGITVNADDVAINLTTTGNTGSTSSNSGLEVSSSGVTLLKGCADNQILKYTDAGGWACANDDSSGGGSGTNYLQLNNGALAAGNQTVDFLLGSTATSSAKFGLLNVTNGTPTASIAANAGNNATFLTGSGVLGTTAMQTLAIGNASTGNVVIDSGSGVITLSDGTIINGTLTTSGTVNGATITGGSLSATTVNGITTGDIVLTTGSYADPAWITLLAKSKVGLGNVENTALSTWAGSSNITTTGTLTSGSTGAGFTLNFTNSTLTGNITGSNIDESTLAGLTASNLTAGDFSSKITSGTYSIGISGNAATASDLSCTNCIGGTEIDESTFGAITGTSLTLGSGATSAPLSVRGGIGSNAALIVDQLNSGDVIAASASGTTRFRVDSSGNLTTSGTINGATLSGGSMSGGSLTATAVNGVTTGDIALTTGSYADPAWITSLAKSKVGLGNVENTALSTWAGSSNIITTGTLTSGATGTGFTISLGNSTITGTLPVANGGSLFEQGNGAIFERVTTQDFLIGGTASSAAKFAVLNIAGGTPTASLSANSGAGATTLSGLGVLGTMAMQSLAIGNASTGNIVMDSGSGLITLSDNTVLNGTLTGLTGLTIGSGTVSLPAGEIGNSELANASLTVTAGSGLTSGGSVSLGGSTTLNIGAGNGITVNGDDVAINLTTSGTTGATSSNSGLEVSSSGLTLLKGCNDNELLKYTDAGGWACASDVTGGGGGTNYLQLNNGALASGNQTVDFLLGSTATGSAKFGFLNVNSGTPTASISANSGANASFLTGAGVLGTTNAQTLTIGNASTGNVVIDSGSGVITLADGTMINGTLTTSGTVNSATITGGSLSATAVNGVNTADIALTSGSYADPAWITSLAKSKVGLGNVENTALSSWAGTSSITTVGTLTSGATGAGFTLNFTNSTLSGNITGSNIDESTFGAIAGTSLTLGSGATSAPLSVRGGIGSNAALIIDQLNNGDLIAASASGTTRFRVDGSGNVIASGTINGATLSGGSVSGGSLTTTAVNGVTTGDIVLTTGSYADPAWITSLAKSKVGLGNVENTALSTWAGSSNITTTGTLTSGATGTGFTIALGSSTITGILPVANGGSLFEQANGAMKQRITTQDLLIGGTATSSAKFAVLNIAGGTPTASISANAGNNASFLTGAGVLGTTNAQTLTIGNSSTGNVVLDSGSGVITLSDGTIINGTLTTSGTINGATLSGGSMSGGSLTTTAVNGVTTGDIVLTSGSYADPAWITSLAKSKVGLGNVENTALSTWAGSSNITTTGTLTSGSTGAGFTLNFTNSTLSGNVTGSNIDESTLSGLTTSNFSSANISQWTNDAGYLTAATDIWNTANGVVTPRFASTVDLLLGATSTSSAKFGFININSGTPTATISGNIVLDAVGSLQTTKNQTLSLGGSTTGNIVIDSGSSLITLSDNTVLNGTLTGMTGLTVGSGTVSLPAGEIGNTELANSSLTVTAGNGLADGGSVSLGGSTTLNIGAGNGITVNADDVAINLTSTGNTGATSSNSGLEVGSGGLTLLKGCNDNEVLKYTDAGGWACASDATGGGGGTNYLQLNNGALAAGNQTVDFLLGSTATSSAKFAVLNVNSGTPTASISANAGANAAYLTGAGVLGTTNMQTLTLGNSSTGNVIIDAGSGLITLSDATSINGTLATSGTINGATLSGGSMSGGSLTATAVNGVTTGDIVLTTGSYADPSWITSLAKSKVGLGSVENTALSTWAGSSNITTTGTLTSGATGAGFTIALGSSTITGSLPFANGGSKWAMDTATNKVITPLNNTMDLVIGGTATSSAKFAVLGMSTNTPSASVSAQNAAGTAVVLDGTGFIQSARNNTLTLGGDKTGNIAISPNNGGAGSLLTINSLLTTFNGTTAITASSLTTLTSSATLGVSATTLNLGGGSAAIIGTVSNDDLTLTPNGSGNIILTATYQSGVRIGSAANTPAPLSIYGGIGSNAALIVANANNGDLFTASAGATTKFTISNAGVITLAGGDGTADIKTQGTNSLKIDTGGAAALGIGTTNTNAITIGKSGITTTIDSGLTLTSGRTLTINADAFTDLTGNGLTVSSNALTVNLTSSGNTGSTSSNSGLEVGSAGLTLLKGCADNEILKYTDAGGWACASDSTSAGGGSSNWTQTNGMIRPNNSTVDVIFGGDSTSSAKFAFMNLNSNSGLDPLASFSGNLRLEKRQNTTTGPTKITQTEPGKLASGGTSLIASISASAVFNGSLYVGTGAGPTGGAEVYRYDGTGSNWTRVSQTTAGTIANGGTANIASVSAMTVFNGKLFVGTSKVGAAEVYRYDGSTTWTKVSQATAGTISDDAAPTTVIDGVTSMAVYGGRLYIGTKKNAGGEVYRYEGSSNWTEVTTTAGQLNATGGAAIDGVTSMAVFNGALYVGTKKGMGASVWRYNGAPGASVFTIAYGATPGNICGATLQHEVSALVVYSGSLYAATNADRGSGSGAEVCRFNYNPNTNTANPTWTRITQAAGTIRFGGTSGIDGITAMTVYNSRLYIGTHEPNGAQIYEYIDGTDWILVNATPGTIAAGGTANIDKISTLTPYNDYLYMGTSETGPTTTTAAEVYTYKNIIDQSYALKFHAASQWAPEQNGQINEASIYYLASASANLGSAAGNTGSFIFSHGIQTRNGSYDVAEDYPTRDDSLEPGDVVAIDSNERGFVKKAERRGSVLGVYSQNPALRLTQQDAVIDGARAIPVALAGRVPVKVSTENGEIKPGDSLTASSIPGVAMKATKAGQVIGQAMEPLSCHPEQSEGSTSNRDSSPSSEDLRALPQNDKECIGKVLAYVATSYFIGEKSELSGKELLFDLMTKKESFGSEDEVSIMSTDRLVAGLEIVTPRVIADEIIARNIKADNIEGLDKWGASIMDRLLSELSSRSAVIASSALQNEAISDGIATSSSTPRNDIWAALGLSSQRDATISGTLRVKENTLIEGVLNVIDTMTTTKLIVNTLANFFGDVVFHGDVAFRGRPTFNKDTAGFAIIKKDADSVEVKFDREYEALPVITANITLDDKEDPKEKADQDVLGESILSDNIKFIVIKRTTKGFTIKINKKTPVAITFSWTAVAVEKPVTSESGIQIMTQPGKEEN